MSRRVKKPRFMTQLVAVLVVFGMVRPGRGAPGDVFEMAAPMLGADPPAGVALRDGDSSVSTQTGALQYSYPITVPAGRLGNEPSLALTYSSQAPLYGGIAAGWSLSIPEIQRDTADGTLFQLTLTPDLRAQRRFLSTMAGSRPLIEVDEPKASGVYATFRAQNDTSYARYEWMEDGQPFQWRVYTPDGTTHYFGDASLVTGTLDMDRVPLTRTVDEFGNTVEYAWIWEGNGLYIDEIRYTSNPDANLPSFAKVKFHWNAAPVCATTPVGAQVSYRSGEFEQSGAKTLGMVVATSWDPDDPRLQHTRQITLGYDAAVEACDLGHAPYRQLQQIQESAWGWASPRVDLPPVRFGYGTARRDVWQSTGHGTWIEDDNPGALTWGTRSNSAAWPQVRSMLLDLDGDGLVDRLRSGFTADTCKVQWERNTGTSFAVMPDILLPHLPFGNVTPDRGCSLNGQLSYYRTEHGGSASCGAKNDGSYLAYRWLDVNGDGLPDLVTAIHHDANLYDPNAPGEAPFGPWPACDNQAASLLLQERCMTAAVEYCDGEACGLDGDVVAGCLEDESNEWETIFKTQACDGGIEDTVACEGGAQSVSRPCDFLRVPHERCGRYPWIIYFNEGNGELGDPVIKLSPIPLESDGGDSPSGAGGFTSTKHAITDLDGDGLTDAVAMPRWDQDPGMPEVLTNPMWWWVWKGTGTGEFVGDADGRPFFWFAPEGARPAHSEGTADDDDNKTVMATGGLADLNGDGLQDYYWRRPGTSQVRVWWNNGSQFTQSDALSGVDTVSVTYMVADTVQYPGPWIAEGTAWKKTQLLDYDDDGRADLLHSVPAGTGWTGPRLKFNDGGDLLAGYAPGPFEDGPLTLWTDALLSSPLPIWETRKELTDLDGDGIAEQVTIDGNAIVKRGRPKDGQPPRLLTRVDNGTGLHVDIRYAPLSDVDVVTSDVTIGRASPQTKWVVESMTTTDDFDAGGESVVTYRYIRPVWSPDDRGDWGFRGFEKVRTTAPSGAVTEEVYDYHVDWSGRLGETVVVPTEDQSAGARAPTTITQTTWQRYPLFGDRIVTFHPTITRTLTCNRGQLEFDCRSNPAALQRTEQVWSLQGTPGRMWAKTVDKLQDSDYQDAGDRYTTTSYTLVADPTNYRLRPRLVESKWLNDAVDETYAKSETIWDATFREARQEIVWFADGSSATTKRTYDAAGNVVTVQKPNQVASGGPVTTLAYDSAGRFVRTTTNEAGHVVETHFEPGTSATLRTIGPNTHSCHPSCGANLGREETRTDVDGLGRALATWVTRDANPGYTLVQVGQGSYVDSPAGTSVPTSATTRQLVDFGGTRWTEERASYDGHGRLIESLVVTTPQARTTYDYADDGTLRSVTLPDPSQPSGSVTYHYSFDSLGRATGMRRPDASGVDLAYDGLEHTRSEVTGPAGGADAVTQLVHDAFGRLAVVREKASDNGPDFAETFYEYDPRDTVTRIQDPDGITTELVHDWAGRRIEIRRESRTWKYRYDANGNLESEVSPIPGGNALLEPLYTTSYAYDALDRATSRLVATRNLTQADRQLFGIHQIAFSYDVAGDGANRTGRLSETRTLYGTTPVLRRLSSYDAEGNLTEDRAIYNLAGVTGERRIKTTFGPGGKVVEVDYGDGTTADGQATRSRTSYDERANPIKVETRQIGGNNWVTQASFVRNAAGVVTQRSRPGTPSQVAEWGYDPLGRIIRQRVTVGTTTIANQDLTYWGSDDPKTLRHTGSGLAQRDFTFTYDDRHQLAQVTTSQASFGSSYQFSHGGRLGRAVVNAAAATGSDVKNRDVTYVYQAADPEMLSALERPDGTTFASYEYDDAGNVTTRIEEGLKSTFLWDGDDQLRRAQVGKGREEYYYSGEGARFAVVKRILGPSGWQVTQVKLFHGPLEIWLSASGTPTNRYAHVGAGTPVARVETTTAASTIELQYHSTLQSLLAAIGTDGSVKATFAYGPYGETLQHAGSQTGSHRRRYNDKHQDDLTGLHYYGYRYYDSTSLVWTAADPLFRFAPDRGDRRPRLANLYTFNLNNPARFVDPDGRIPLILVPIIVGAVIGASAEGCNQIQEGEADVGRLANAATGGAIGGAIYAVAGPAGLRATALTGGFSAMIGGETTRMLNGDDTSAGDVASDFLIGAAAGGASVLFPRAAEAIKTALKGAPKAAPAGGAARPKGVPSDWVAKSSKTGGGTRFVDPANPHNSVRVMPGDPKSPFPNSQKPYVRHLKDGQSLDVDGNVVPKDTPEAHIPLEDFEWPF